MKPPKLSIADHTWAVKMAVQRGTSFLTTPAILLDNVLDPVPPSTVLVGTAKYWKFYKTGFRLAKDTGTGGGTP